MKRRTSPDEIEPHTRRSVSMLLLERHTSPNEVNRHTEPQSHNTTRGSMFALNRILPAVKLRPLTTPVLLWTSVGVLVHALPHAQHCYYA